MKSLEEYIFEMKSKQNKVRDGIKFTIWRRPEKKIKWLSDNKSYQKIEYKFEDRENMIFIQFLLGYDDNTWKLWAGKIGGVSYDDDPYCKLDTDDFAQAILKGCDKIEEIIDKVKKEPTNYIQYYRQTPSAPQAEESDDMDMSGDEGEDEGGKDLL